MASTREVTGTLLDGSAQPVKNKELVFTLSGGTFTSDAYVIRSVVPVFTSETGTFSVDLLINSEGADPTYWTCALPDGNSFTFEVKAGATPLSLGVLRTQEPAVPPPADKYDAETWDLIKRAVRTYSRFRPYLALIPITQVVGVSAYPAPPLAFAVEGVGVADLPEITHREALFPTEGGSGWAFNGGTFYILPAPTTTDPFPVLWRCYHACDDETQSVPTVPEADWIYIERLVEAEVSEAEELTPESSGYTIGGTTVRWTNPNRMGSGVSRAARIRASVYAELGDTLGTME